jgi:uncharacterized protein YbbK (DUF523 family)
MGIREWGSSMNVMISRCLLGEPCRWHGKPVRPSSWVKKFLSEHPGAEIVPVCPEELGGLPTPRPPVKRRKGRVYETCADKQNRNNVTGNDVTAAFEEGARRTADIAIENECQLCILCKWSPSCDRTGITGKALLAAGREVINTW